MTGPDPISQARRALSDVVAAAAPPGVVVHADPPLNLTPPCVVVRSGGGRGGTVGGTLLVDMHAAVTAGGGDAATQAQQMEGLVWVVVSALRGAYGRTRGGTPPTWTDPVSDGTYLSCSVDLTVPVSE